MPIASLERALASLCSAYPTRSKWVFVKSHAAGRTLADALVLQGTDWVNLRFVTPFDLALRMGAPFLVEQGIDPSEEGLGPASVMRLLLQCPEEGGYFRPLATQPQMASALWSTLRELRMAGVRPADLSREVFESSAKHRELVALLDAYEAFLMNGRRGDKATVFEEALRHLDWCPIAPHDCWTDLPDTIWSPLEERLFEALPGERVALEVPTVTGVDRPRRLPVVETERRMEPPVSQPGLPSLPVATPPSSGQLTLDLDSTADAPSGSPSPGAGSLSPVEGRLSFFHAGGPEAEVEEVFRRILTSGRPLDDVEIVCGSEGYASLIWEKALRYEWPVTLGPGVPATLTRPGRALLGLLEWIEDDFSAGLLRRLLQSGDVRLEGLSITAGRAARLLVKAQAAWGRRTYRLALGRFAAGARRRASRDDVGEDERASLERRAVEASALADWIATIIDSIPSEDAEGLIDLQQFAAAAHQFVAGSAARASALDGAAAMRLSAAIHELEALGTFRCSPAQALRFVRERVEDLHIGGDRPRPGHLYVSQLADAGLAPRRLVFVVGLEEGRVFPQAFEDPVLLDAERRRISPALRLSTDAVDEAVHAVMSRLTGLAATPGLEICLSYSCRDLRQFRETYASWVMLHMLRLAEGNPALTYRELHQRLGAPVSCVPDAADRSPGIGRWWLHAVTRAAEADGQRAVLREFPALAAGRRAADARASDDFTEFDGYVAAAGPVLDPCASDRIVSPTQLEEAAACPFRYFLKRGLRVEAIESGERDRDVWLDPLLRGSLLHDLYAGLLRRCRDEERRVELTHDRDWLLGRGREALAAVALEMPPPSAEVHERESAEFLSDLGLFLEGEIGAPGRTPIALEVGFGRAGDADGEPLSQGDPMVLDVGGLTFRIAGRIDRIDRLDNGSFEILDYKTGTFWSKGWKGTFAGGRRLQHALYGLAAVELLKRQSKRPRVTGAQYYFSSAKGRQERKHIATQSVAKVGEVLSDLRDVITAGLFIHTPSEEDCKFCDYGPACGTTAHGRAHAKQKAPVLGPYRKLAAHE